MSTIRTYAAALALVLILSACGGGGSDAPTPVAQCQPGPVSIALYGDSTNDGVDGATHQRAVPDPTGALQILMESRFGPNKVGVSNRAVSGSASGDLAAVSSEFDIAVVNFGINDARLGVPIATYKANLRKLYRPGVVFKTPNPIWGHQFDLVDVDDSAYAQAMREVAQELGAPLIDTQAYVLTLQAWQGLIPDGLHPTSVLYGLIAQDSMATLAPVVTALQCR